MWNTKTKIFGMPLLSIGFYAHGFIAIGWAATGVITVAQFGAGIISITQFGLGVVSVAQFTAGFITLAQGGIGILVSIGQGALGFAAIGFDSAAGYYVVKDPRSISAGVAMLYRLIAPDPFIFLAWSGTWITALLFFLAQKDKFTGKWKFADFFRGRLRHNDPGVRVKALEKIGDDKGLLSVAVSDPDPAVQRAAVERIRNLALLVLAAKDPRCAAAHDIAAGMIHDEALLAEIARESADPSIADDVMAKIGNQELLREIARNARQPEFRGSALALLDSPGEDFLLEIARKESSAAVLAPLVNKAKSNETLAAVIRNCDIPGVRIAAINKLAAGDDSLAADLLMNETDDRAALALASMLGDRSLLERAASGAQSPRARIAALYALKNPDGSFLLRIIEEEKDLSVCEAAMFRVADQRRLLDLALDAKRPSHAVLAVNRIDDRALLENIAARAPDESIRERARRRLDAVQPVYYSFKIELDCPSCSQPVFVNGPLEKTRCRSCLSKVELGGQFWKTVFDSQQGMVRYLTYHDLIVERTGSGPRCPKCGNELDADDVPAGTDGSVACGKCGTESPTFPVPVKFEGMENAEQVFCGEREGEEREELSKAHPVAVSCIKCGAPLTVTAETPRNATCGYCNTPQYLPDPLWLSLHPVKTKRTWYLRCSYHEAGKLKQSSQQ